MSEHARRPSPDPLPVSFVRWTDVLEEVVVESFKHHFVVGLI
jgi:hypothetical protein